VKDSIEVIASVLDTLFDQYLSIDGLDCKNGVLAVQGESCHSASRPIRDSCGRCKPLHAFAELAHRLRKIKETDNE
jgi:hypothetical protein